MKGEWQWNLKVDKDLAGMSVEWLKERKLLSAMEQCNNGMILDEAPVGAIS